MPCARAGSRFRRINDRWWPPGAATDGSPLHRSTGVPWPPADECGYRAVKSFAGIHERPSSAAVRTSGGLDRRVSSSGAREPRSSRRGSLFLWHFGTEALTRAIDMCDSLVQGTAPAPAAWDHRPIQRGRRGLYIAGTNPRGKEDLATHASLRQQLHQHFSLEVPQGR